MNDDNVKITSTIFSIHLTPHTRESFLRSCQRLLSEGVDISIATVNPEILLRAKKDNTFRETLSSCTLRIVDGFGISFVSFMKYGYGLPRLTGTEAVEQLVIIAKHQSLVIGVVGGRRGRAALAVKYLEKIYPSVKFVDVLEGQDCQVNSQGHFLTGEKSFSEGINKHTVNILLVAFGAEKQESFILQQLQKYPQLRIGIGIGGLIDVWSGNIKRPPNVFSRLGIEWLWRLFQEPRRFTRILNAVIVFPIQAFFFDRHI